MKIINPKKLNDIYFPGWNTYVNLNHEKGEISVSMSPNWDNSDFQNGTGTMFRIETKGKKLSEVKALLQKIYPIYEKALKKYSSSYDENFNLIGSFKSVSELNDIRMIIEKFNRGF